MRCSAAVERADAEARVGGEAAAQRDRERELLDVERPALAVEGPEGVAPLLRAHAPDLLEAPAEQRARRVVVEDELALLVDEEGGGGEPGDQVPGVDQLERALALGHGPTLTPARDPRSCRAYGPPKPPGPPGPPKPPGPPGGPPGPPKPPGPPGDRRDRRGARPARRRTRAAPPRPSPRRARSGRPGTSRGRRAGPRARDGHCAAHGKRSAAPRGSRPAPRRAAPSCIPPRPMVAPAVAVDPAQRRLDLGLRDAELLGQRRGEVTGSARAGALVLELLLELVERGLSPGRSRGRAPPASFAAKRASFFSRRESNAACTSSVDFPSAAARAAAKSSLWLSPWVLKKSESASRSSA